MTTTMAPSSDTSPDIAGETVLHLVGLPVLGEMDGRVVTEMMEEKFLLAHPAREIDTYGPNRRTHTEPVTYESREEIEKQLKALGYLD